MSYTQKKGLKRGTIDKFYTTDEIVLECMKNINKRINISEYDLCIEPSAGNGSFISSIKELGCHYKFYDLHPENNEIHQKDYLEFDHEKDLDDDYSKIHIIGNPPFGRQSSLAIKFIKKSCEFCHTLSFILPRSFKKDSLKKHFPLKFHLIYEFDLPRKSFLMNNEPYDVPCVFQIWERQSNNRNVPVKLTPNHYKFVKKEDKHDISFRRVGGTAGMISTETENKSKQSHYFIDFDIPFTRSLFSQLTKIKYGSRDHTVGPKSISKQELIAKFNQVISENIER
jgi:predicted RNA methylase